MKWSIGTKIGIGYGLGIVALLTIGAASYSSLTRLLKTVDWVDHTYKVIGKTDDMINDMVNAEAGERGYALLGRESFLEPYRTGTANLGSDMREVRRLTEDNPAQQRRMDELERLFSAQLDLYRRVVETRRSRGPEPAATMIARGNGNQRMESIRAAVTGMKQAESDLLKRRSQESNAQARATVLTIAVGVSLATALLTLAGLLIVRSISIPLGQITAASESIASGDLNVALSPTNRKDEIGVLAQAFSRMAGALRRMATGAEEVAAGNLAIEIKPQSEQDVMGNTLSSMVARLASLIGQVQRSGIQVNTSATEIAAMSKQQQATAHEISATTAQIGATSKEIAATATELVKAMDDVAQVAERTAGLAGSGQTGLARMETTMSRIMEASETISARLTILSERASNINTVVTTITKVADQTNLLSLNAAIEAEKAGEYGRGFGVVATEIRRLADQTALATADIEQMVKDMQSAVSAGVMGMDKFAEEVRTGVGVVDQVSEELTQIIQQVQTLTPRFEAVNEGMQAQALGAQQISEALAQLTDAAQQTVESLHQGNLAIEQLNEATSGLQAGVSRFVVQA